MDPAAWVAIISAVIGAYQGHESQRIQKGAQQRAKQAADQQALEADRANNMANQKRPDITAIQRAVIDANKLGGNSTMLTGAQGVNQSSLLLGRNTLLGGGSLLGG